MRSKAAGFLTPGDGIELCGDEWRSEKDRCVTHNNRGTCYAYILWIYVHAHPEKYTPNKGGCIHNMLSYYQHVRTCWPMRFQNAEKWWNILFLDCLMVLIWSREFFFCLHEGSSTNTAFLSFKFNWIFSHHHLSSILPPHGNRWH